MINHMSDRPRKTGASVSFGFVLVTLLAAPAFAESIDVTLSGNFGPSASASSVFDNQNYTVNFLIPDVASPSSSSCCFSGTAAIYNVNADFAVPGIGLSLDDAVQVQYFDQAPSGQWLTISFLTGLPGGNYFVLAPFQVDSGDLWNGLVGALGTPAITLLNNAPGTGSWFLESGLQPIAQYANGTVTITASSVPEPAAGFLLAAAIVVLVLVRQKRIAATRP